MLQMIASLVQSAGSIRFSSSVTGRALLLSGFQALAVSQ